mgnify:CR=1 FL=1
MTEEKQKIPELKVIPAEELLDTTYAPSGTRTGGLIMGLPIDATLGERIRFYRQQAGLTQKELAGL